MSKTTRRIRDGLLASLLAFVAWHTSSFAQTPPSATMEYDIGRTPNEQEVAMRSISVAPSGSGLPKGASTAKEGRKIYEAQCAACHGLRGEGMGSYDALVGGQGTLASDKPVLTVGSYWPYATTVWDYINRAMPYQAAGTLSADEVYGVTAYILFLNGIVGESEVLDQRTLPRIRMPNRNGFVPDPRPDVRR